ncbi:LysR family transcriptional regulator [Anaerobacillus arseniciselenatis]|uniref:LysR family transcriptional regulator n=1 Tax=Anaerobacillus arseniciselenatis TaxID=85682 RepID=A0A1S2LHL2_9BACI|nr:LysR family transcriptional regulator [Anaerobacillus arseniciselenatis]OIJ11563.1 LysR family transcriptional regulator [Anaerobacillus arseniciselenatis]
MNLLALRYFLEVARYLNFSHAACNLHISQPGLSQQITLLEQQLGFKLLIRTTRSVTLTEEGEYLYKNLIHSFKNIEHVVDELQQLKMIPQKTIKIATVPSAASHLLPGLLCKMKEEFPGIEFYIKETTSLDAIEMVKEKECNIALVRTPTDTRSLVEDQLNFVEFTRHPLQLVVSPQHALASEHSLDLSKLKDESFIHFDKKQSPSLYFLLEQVCQSAGFIPKVLAVGPELLTIANLIAKGIGVTIMPSDMVSLLPPQHIKAIDLENESFYSSISAVWDSSDHLPMITQYALEQLGELCDEEYLVVK